MFQDAGVIAEFVFSQLPSPRDALAIIDGLVEELPRTAWARATLWPEELVTEMRAQSLRIDNDMSVAVAWDILRDRTNPLTRKRRHATHFQRRLGADTHAALVRKLKQDCEEYAVKASRVGNEWHALLLKTGLPPCVQERIMSFLLLRADSAVGRGPQMYCLRCRRFFQLYQYTLHVAGSADHIQAVLNA
jgi:hypothetical protein